MPRVSVITTLSYDHMAVLGNTLALIAGEKAGIIKPGIPVVCSPQPDEALAVLEDVAAKRGAELILVGRDVVYEELEHSLEGQSLAIADPRQGQIPKSVILRIPLLGFHQVINAATAYTALRASGLGLSEKAIQTGFRNVHWPCRFEVLRREGPVVIDSAHNVDSARRLRQTLDEYFPDRPVFWVFSILEDKDAAGMLAELKPRLKQVIATQTDHPRVLAAEKIVDLMGSAGVPVEAVRPVSAALERAMEMAGDRGLVLIAGSVAFAGEMKTVWEKR
jgi:dihydrofolate synthase/folylpolyglutamate synthase